MKLQWENVELSSCFEGHAEVTEKPTQTVNMRNKKVSHEFLSVLCRELLELQGMCLFNSNPKESNKKVTIFYFGLNFESLLEDVFWKTRGESAESSQQ